MTIEAPIPPYLVHISVKTEDGKISSGTGFTITRRGHIATSRHVVFPEGIRAKDILVTIRFSGEPWKYRIVDFEVDADIAIIEGVVPSSVDLPFARLNRNWTEGTNIGQSVTVYGHSSINNYPSGQGYPGTISGFAERDAKVGIVSPIYPGDSGGPVVSRDELVIGIVVSRDTKRDTQARFSPISQLLDLAKKNGLDISLLNRSSPQFSSLTEATQDQALDEPLINLVERRTHQAPFQGVDAPDILIGREQELLNIESAMSSGKRIIALRGALPGIGKTSLAAKVAELQRTKYADGVLWARPDLEDIDSILCSFVGALNGNVASLQLLRTDSAKRRHIRELLATKHCLVVFDNVTNAGQVAEIVPAIGETQVLITSKISLALSLKNLTEIQVGPLSSESALELLQRLLGAVHRETTETQELEMIANELGHVPLALRVASGLMLNVHWLPSQFLRRLRQSPTLEFLSSDWDPVAASIRQSLELAYSELPSPDIQKIFRILGIFEERVLPIQLVSVASGCDLYRTENQLSILKARGLVDLVRQGEIAAILHPLIKRFCVERLMIANEQSQAHLAAGNAYRSQMRSWDNQSECFDYTIVGAEKDAKFSLEAASHYIKVPALPQAQNILIAGADTLVLAGMGTHLIDQIEKLSALVPLEPWLEVYRTHHWLDSGSEAEQNKAYKVLSNLAKNSDPKVASAALIVAARGHFHRHDYIGAEEGFRQSLEIKLRMEPKDIRGAAFILNELAHICIHTRGEYKEALALHREALSMQESLGDKKGISYTLRRISSITLHYQKKVKLAIRYLDDALNIATEIGAIHTIVAVLCEKSEALRQLRKYSAALSGLKKALQIARRSDEASAEIFVLKRLALLYEGLEMFGHAYESVQIWKTRRTTTTRVDREGLAKIEERISKKWSALKEDLRQCEVTFLGGNESTTREMIRRAKRIRQRLNLEPARIGMDADHYWVPPIESVLSTGFEPVTASEAL